MDAYLRVGLIVIAALILFVILLEARIRRRRLKVAELSQLEQSSKEEPTFTSIDNQGEYSITSPEMEKRETDTFLTLSVFAKPNTTFASYELLQAISATGMQFGEWNIFHRYDEDKSILFSLASATKPGEFNLDRMGDFSCVGLTLFMDLSAVNNPGLALNKMLETAEQLADDLDGELRSGPYTMWSQDILQQYRQKVLDYQNETYS